MFPFDLLDKLDDLTVLDPVAGRLSKVVVGVVKPNRVEDILHGTWLGHPLHSVLVQVPIGSFVSASMLDLVGNDDRSPDLLAAVGLASAVPTALAGATDWSKSNPSTQRPGLVHALLNTISLGLWASSLVARRRGNRSKGVRLGLMGTAVLGVSGTIGGHLAYRQGLGANSDSDIADLSPTGWTDAGSDDLPEAQLVLRSAAGTQVVLVRDGERISALANRCAHQSGPLHEGSLSEGCVTCPWHGSTYRMTDGAVVHGPSVHPQPTFDVRRSGGRLQVKLHT